MAFKHCPSEAQACRLPARRHEGKHDDGNDVNRHHLSLIAFTLPSTPYSVQMARFYVRAALSYHDLGDFIEDAEMVTSEIMTNAVQHADAQAIGLELTSLEGSGAVAIVVTDPSHLPPVRHDLEPYAECGRGLDIVAALSARWGWRPQSTGKAVFAILTREA